jgi:hypothetical protein
VQDDPTHTEGEKLSKFIKKGFGRERKQVIMENKNVKYYNDLEENLPDLTDIFLHE